MYHIRPALIASPWLACLVLATACHSLQAQTSTAPEPPPAPSTKPIQPSDGQWRWTMGPMQSSNTCLPGAAQSLAALLPQQRTEHVQFNKPFHPAQLVNNTAIRWQQRGPNYFVAEANGINVQGFPLPLDARYELTIQSPTRMRGDATVTMNVWQTCTVQAPFDFTYQSATPAQAPAPARLK